MSASPSASPPAVSNGTYTVTSPDGRHFTAKIHTAQKGGLAGKRIVSLMVGPNNESDFVGVAFWNEGCRTGEAFEERAAIVEHDGSIPREDAERLASGCHAKVWMKHRSASAGDGALDGYRWDRNWSKVEKKVAVLVDLAVRGERGRWYGNGYRMLVESRCARCNRKLTTPESLRLGRGPECATR